MIKPLTTLLLLTACTTMPTQRQILCHGPVAKIADNDPGLALFTEGPLADRKVALAIERANSCDHVRL